MLQPEVRERAEEYKVQFASAQPFRHVVIEPFLDPDALRGLMDEFPSFESGHSANERGEAGRKAVHPNLATLGGAYGRFDALMRERGFLDLMSGITAIPDLLYDPDYVGGGTHENLEGQELDTHVDFNYHPALQLHRRLNLIVFLNPRWEQSWGGCLELLPDPWTPGPSIVPLANRCVIFETTESSWHGFKRIRLPEDCHFSRRSIAVYFYTKDRPAQETAASHGTVYYQRPLPDRLQAGHTLSDADMWELETLIARRDKQIQFLYHRELEFSEAIQAITGSPSFRIGRVLTWPMRIARAWIRSR